MERRVKTLVSFDTEEYEQIVKIVKEREKFKGQWERISNSDTERITGFQAEYALRYLLGKEAVLDEKNYLGGAGNCDIWYKEKKISVRSSEKISNNLLVRESELTGVDYFFLCISKPKFVWIVGWTTSKTFRTEANFCDPNNLGKPCWIMSKEKLEPVSEFFNISDSSSGRTIGSEPINHCSIQ